MHKQKKHKNNSEKRIEYRNKEMRIISEKIDKMKELHKKVEEDEKWQQLADKFALTPLQQLMDQGNKIQKAREEIKERERADEMQERKPD